MGVGLDEKLRKILHSWESQGLERGWGTIGDENNAIAQIKEAFAEEGYRPAVRQIKVSSFEEAMKIQEERIPVMTGQEWYERFAEEYLKADPYWITVSQSNGRNLQEQSNDVRQVALDCAKKAANL